MQIPPKNKYKLIPVPEERLGGGCIFEFKQIEGPDGQLYDIEDFYVLEKSDEIHQGGLMLLATGQFVPKQAIWEKYKNSSKLYMIIAREVKNG